LTKVQLNDYTNGRQAELLTHCEGRLQQLYDTVINDARTHFEQRIGQMQSQGAAASTRPLAKARPADESCSTLGIIRFRIFMPIQAWAFSRNGNMMELFIETIGPSWKGVPSILRTSRFLNTEFSEDALPEMRALKTQHEPSARDLEYGIDFVGKADALYKLIMPHLPTVIGTELRQNGVTNGFELFRKLIQKMDPPRGQRVSSGQRDSWSRRRLSL
jgi:hypothetical protein